MASGESSGRLCHWQVSRLMRRLMLGKVKMPDHQRLQKALKTQILWLHPIPSNTLCRSEGLI